MEMGIKTFLQLFAFPQNLDLMQLFLSISLAFSRCVPFNKYKKLWAINQTDIGSTGIKLYEKSVIN